MPPISTSLLDRTNLEASGPAFSLLANHDRIAGSLVIVEFILTGAVALLCRDLHSFHQRVRVVSSLRTIFSAFLAGLVGANVAFMVFRLATVPDAFGNKDELSITAAALVALWCTDAMRSVRRRRIVAELLNAFPKFRYGSTGFQIPGRGKNLLPELIVRTSLTRVLHQGHGAPYKRGQCSFFQLYAPDGDVHLPSKALIVLYDRVAQVWAGSELTSAGFIHATTLDMKLVACVIWNAIQRSNLLVLGSWERNPASRAVHILRQTDTVRAVFRSELWRSIPDVRPAAMVEEDPSFEELLWSVMTTEVIEYLETGIEMKVLPRFVDMPLTIMEQGASEWVPSIELSDMLSHYEERMTNDWKEPPPFPVSDPKSLHPGRSSQWQSMLFSSEKPDRHRRPRMAKFLDGQQKRRRSISLRALPPAPAVSLAVAEASHAKDESSFSAT